MFNLNVVIPPNTTAQIYVPTTNASAITESGVPAASSPGVSYAGLSNGCAIYAVGSGQYMWTSPFAIPVAPTVIVTTTNQTGSGSGTYYPSWNVITNGSLIAGKSPSVALGNFSEEVPGRNVNSLTAGGNLGLTQIPGTYGYTTSTNYVTCGNGVGPDGSSAGSTVVYTLTGAANGYDLTNITVYGGWADNGRDQQAYTVYYSTVTVPTNFLSLAVVNFNPAIASSIQSATRLTLTSSSGVLATNAVALKFDFTSPGSENGYCGYAAITVFGTASAILPATLSGTLLPGRSSFVMQMSGLLPGQNYTLQSTTNLVPAAWLAETNFIANQSVAVFTNPIANVAQKFYRLVAN
jgi:hypothetical protein